MGEQIYNLKIKKVEIEAFRGISQKLSLDFSHGKAIGHTILYGENGSGKSSVVDALELATQGKLYRTTSLQSKNHPFAKSLSTSKQTTIICTLSNGDEFKKTIDWTEDEPKVTSYINGVRSTNHVVHGFNISPIAIRRKDIIEYSSEPSHSKLVYLFDFVRRSKIDKENQNNNEDLNKDRQNITEIKELKDKIQELKIRRKDEFDLVIKKWNLNGQGLDKWDDFLTHQVYYGVDRAKRHYYDSKRIRYRTNMRLLSDLKTITALNKIISDLNIQIKNIKSLTKKEKGDDKPNYRVESVAKFLRGASEFISSAFKQISTCSHVDRINLRIGELSVTSVEIDVILINGAIVAPNSILSEANNDLLSLLVMIGLHQEAAKGNQHKVILLDDVFQSVDQAIKVKFLKFVINNLKDWQVIWTVHDRLWLDQLNYLIKRHDIVLKSYEFVNWTFDLGPVISQNSFDYIARIDDLISENKFDLLAMHTSRLLEIMCNQLSISLGTSVARKKDDKYTIGDLWPNLRNKLKKTSLTQLVEEVDDMIYLRNLYASHYNEWAQNLSTADIVRFAQAIKKLHNEVYCPSCLTYISSIEDNKCKCGNLELK